MTDYAVPPGAYLQEWLEDHQWSLHKMASFLAFSHSAMSAFLEGKYTLTPILAEKLEEITSIKAATWLRMEHFYLKDLARLSAP